MKLKWFEKKVDERQEKELLKVEHNSFWFMYWLLLAAILIQMLFIKDGMRLAAGEGIVFMATSVYVLFGCIKRGVWSYQTRKAPGMKQYLKYSVICMLVVGLPFGILHGLKWNKGDLKGLIISVAIYMVSLFIMSFAAYWSVGSMVKRRERKLEEQAAREAEEEEEDEWN